MSTEAKHTPGPWMDWRQDHENVVTAGQKPDGSFPIIAAVRFDRKDANARLIAAAPDLMAMIRELLTIHEAHHNHPSHAAARRLIAKAEGRQI